MGAQERPMKVSLRDALAGVAVGVAIGVVIGRLSRARGQQPGRRSKDVVADGVNVHVERAQLEKAVAALLEKAGAVPAHAAASAKTLVAADVRGVPSHGVNRAEFYCGEVMKGLIDGAAVPKILCETASTANVDGCNGLGAVVSEFAMDLCMRKAKATGSAVVVCHNSNHFGIAGYWSEMAMREGLIGLAFTNTSPFTIATRGRTRACGTNPISCFCPAGADSFQLDMATSTVPVGKVEVLHRKGTTMPAGWGVDASGQSTQDPSAVLGGGGLTPLGGAEDTAGYKGYGLNMMVEILCAVLSGCKDVGPDVPPWSVLREGTVDFGHCFICIDPEQLLPNGRFQQRLCSYLTRMRGLAPTDRWLPVLVPGDPEREEERLASRAGVRLNENVAAGLRNAARELGVEETLPREIREMPESDVPKHPLLTGK